MKSNGGFSSVGLGDWENLKNLLCSSSFYYFYLCEM